MEIGYKGGYIGMKCELRYVAHGYKRVLTNIKYVLIIIVGVCVGANLNIPTYIVDISAVVPFIMLYITGYLYCKRRTNAASR